MLTKSDLQSFLQCSRKLWLERHRPELIPVGNSSSHRREFDGNIVGEKARLQLGAEFIWPASQGTRESAAEEAKRLLDASPDRPAAEVPMLEGGVYARADALVPIGPGYALRETKASSFPLKGDKVTPASPKEHHLEDIAIQAWVMTQEGIPLARAELNLLNNQWRYPGGDDYGGLFRQLDVTAQIAPLMDHVPQWRDEAEGVVAADDMPVLTTGRQCSEPYKCPFDVFCAELDPAGPEHPIELLPDAAGKSLARKLKEAKGYVSILEPAPEELTGKQADLYRRIQEAHRTGKGILVPGSTERMAELPYPRYFFDFEGIDLPVPRWPGTRPYEQIAFQWSCHIERVLGEFEHAEFLDLSGNDPSLACIQRMMETIDPDDGGPILVYHATYEKGRLAELADRHPKFAPVLQTYIDRAVDLLPLVKEFFYHPAMHGSFSIKKVLPVVAPDLDYEELDEVQEGTGAQVAYIEAALNPNTSPERRAEIEQKLKTYCCQDTWAMVEVAYFLAQAGRPVRPNEM
ncbi:DUF2779 domain-containing protein [Shumkonia mesophila]|uniref:DUF2779 domain-containing protein n=1 Tax=Shumkonia mesophila TaxID=2838854 RepID=UPI0029351174|nr:DUF2779 domain-containing protein [Shumkonia mesophila]